MHAKGFPVEASRGWQTVTTTSPLTYSFLLLFDTLQLIYDAIAEVERVRRRSVHAGKKNHPNKASASHTPTPTR